MKVVCNLDDPLTSAEYETYFTYYAAKAALDICQKLDNHFLELEFELLQLISHSTMTKRPRQQNRDSTTQTQTETENEHLHNEIRLLRRKLELVRRVEFLPDCEALSDLPHDMWSVIFSHHFKRRELAKLALVNKCWAQRIREILEPQRPFKRLFRIRNVSRDMEPWRSRKWQFQGAEWNYQCNSLGTGMRFGVHLCRVLSPRSKHLPLYVHVEHRLVHTKRRLMDLVYRRKCRFVSEEVDNWGKGFTLDWVCVDSPQSEWLKDGGVKVELEMKLITEDQFFKRNPDYEKVEQAAREQATSSCSSSN